MVRYEVPNLFLLYPVQRNVPWIVLLIAPICRCRIVRDRQFFLRSYLRIDSFEQRMPVGNTPLRTSIPVTRHFEAQAVYDKVLVGCILSSITILRAFAIAETFRIESDRISVLQALFLISKKLS